MASKNSIYRDKMEWKHPALDSKKWRITKPAGNQYWILTEPKEKDGKTYWVGRCFCQSKGALTRAINRMAKLGMLEKGE